MTKGKYAATTTTSVARSREEIEQTLARFGATGFGYMSSVTDGKPVVAIAFEIGKTRIAMHVTMPGRDQFTLTETGISRSNATIDREHDKEIKRLWRVLANGIKAKLAMVEDGVTTLESEFLAHIIVPSTGRTIGDHMIPQLKSISERYEHPPMLPGGEK